MFTRRSPFVLLLVACVAAGCTPRVKINKNPGYDDHGIRYYRPKPYLLVTPTGVETKLPGKDDKPGPTQVIPSDQFVRLELDYLPDFSEEYSINVKPGLGSANVSLKLEDGWNLTELNQELDSQFDENVGAIADLVGAVGSAVAPTGGANADASGGAGTKKWVVSATNVPIGYYEAVINRDPQCHKQLYGWRYVGFAPFNSCPTQMQGMTSSVCGEDPNGAIYGLVFERGVMTFKQLNAILPETYHVAVPTGEFTTPEPQANDEQLKAKIQTALADASESAEIKPLGVTGYDVAVAGLTIDIKVTMTASDPLVTRPGLTKITSIAKAIATSLGRTDASVATVPPIPAADEEGGAPAQGEEVMPNL